MAIIETAELTGTVATTTSQNIGGDQEPYISGDDLVLQVTVEEGGSAVDISSVTGISWVLDQDGTDEITKTMSDGVAITDGANGVFEVTVSGSDTTSLDTGQYEHEATITDDGDGNQTTLLRGMFTITEPIV